MASRYFGVERGQTRKDVVEGASTNSTGIELVVDLTKVTADSTGMNQVLEGIEYIKQYIISKQKWPPA